MRPGTNTNYESLAGVVGAPLTFADLGKLVSSVILKRDNLKTKAETVGKRLAVFENTRAAELAEMGKIREDVGNGATQITDTWSDQARNQQLVREVNAKRKELAAEIAETRVNAMRGITDALALLKTVRSSWEDPCALLHRSTLGESSRRIYRDNLAGARPKALENAIKTAVATNNKPMLAAALDVLDSMAPEEQAAVNVSRIEAAAMIQGEDFAKAQLQLASLDLAVLESEKADAQIDGKKTGDINLRIGLKRKEVATWAGDEELAASIGESEGEV
jgi:hypothetical protein